MKKSLLLALPVLIILAGSSSCQNNEQKYEEISQKIGFNRYQPFEEPSIEEISKLKFYCAMISQGSFENTYILSIREDSLNNAYGYFKTIDRDMMPALSNEIEVDTASFIYSTIYFKLKLPDIDTLQALMKEYKISQLKDSIRADHLGGRSRELIVFGNGRFFNVFRSYGSEDSIEKNYLDFFKMALKRFTPPSPKPFFRR